MGRRSTDIVPPTRDQTDGPAGAHDYDQRGPNGNRAGGVIEDYPEDVRSHSVLMAGVGNGGRSIHIVCSPKTDFVALITAYLPDPAEWSEDFRERKQK